METETRTELPATVPAPDDYPNKPWSLPPCANPRADGLVCTMRAHSVNLIDGQRVRTHCAQVRDPFIRWVSWHTTDEPAHPALAS